jgi:hypothetical protein
MALTAENKRALPALYANDGKGMDAIAHVKFFNPCGRQTWYITEYDGEDLMFGYVTGADYDEFGYVSLAELMAVRLQFGLYIERDIHFTPKTVAAAVAARA